MRRDHRLAFDPGLPVACDSLKPRKLSPMGLQSRRRGERYSVAKEVMPGRRHIADAP